VARPVRLRTIDPAPPLPRHPHNDTHTTTICAVYIFCVIPLGRIVWAYNIPTARLLCVCVCVCVCQSRAPDLIDVGGARRVTRQKCVFFPLGPKNINDGVYRMIIYRHFIKSFVLLHKEMAIFTRRHAGTTHLLQQRVARSKRNAHDRGCHRLSVRRLPGCHSCVENGDVAHEIYVIIQTYVRTRFNC